MCSSDLLRFGLRSGIQLFASLRNAGVNSEVTRKVVSQSGAQIVDSAVAAVASFELGSQRDSRSEASGIIFRRPGRRWRWRLSRRC